MPTKKSSSTVVPKALLLLMLPTLCYACGSLLWLDGAVGAGLERFLFHGNAGDYFLPLTLTVTAACIQWLLGYCRNIKWLWLPLSSGAVCLVLADAMWLLGGHRILATLLLDLAGPICAGSGIALTVLWLQDRSKPAKCATGCMALLLLTAAVWAWPRPLTDHIDIHFDGKAAFYNETSMSAAVQIPGDDFAALLHRAKIYPTFRAQHWKGEWVLTIRLNEQYVLLAPRDGTPCIYAYTGDMAAFDLTRPKWAVYSHTLHYENLMLHTTGWASKGPGIVGVWEGAGTVSVIGENAPASAEITERWTFLEDGTATVEISSPETTFPAIAYTYTLVDGVLTLTASGRSVEYPCILDTETMTLDNSLVFTRVE